MQYLAGLIANPYFQLSVLTWVTYCYSLKTGFVSDDLSGITEFDGHLQTSAKDDAEAKERRAWPFWKRLMHTEYGMFMRWIRFHLAGGSFPSKVRALRIDGTPGDYLPTGKTPLRHHALSIIVFNIAVLLGYTFLSKVVSPKLAFMAMTLLIVHPITTQGVAWCSGLGYPLSLLYMFSILNLVHLYYSGLNWSTIESVAFYLAFGVLYWLAVNALFVALCLWPILLYFGWYPFAIIGLVVSVHTGLRIVRATINLRSTEFKKQNMGHTVYPKPRKLVVALKTLLYYLKMTFWPDKLGLYHKWGGVYDESIEREDWMALGGLVAAIGLAVLGLYGPAEVQFGLVWFIAFIFIFLNWITIQQFVTERYLMIPAIGIYLIISFYLQDYPTVFALICGLLVMRTWMHLPTYDNELRFYQSNTWNFQDSEIALNNLGCTWVRLGWVATGIDTWSIAQKVNPDYDVTFYNVASHYRTQGMVQMEHGNYMQALEMFKMALEKLTAALNVRRCHFKEIWTKEQAELKTFVELPVTMVIREKQRLDELKKKLSDEFEKATPQRKMELQPSIADIDKRLTHCDELIQQNTRPPST